MQVIFSHHAHGMALTLFLIFCLTSVNNQIISFFFFFAAVTLQFCSVGLTKDHVTFSLTLHFDWIKASQLYFVTLDAPDNL